MKINQLPELSTHPVSAARFRGSFLIVAMVLASGLLLPVSSIAQSLDVIESVGDGKISLFGVQAERVSVVSDPDTSQPVLEMLYQDTGSGFHLDAGSLTRNHRKVTLKATARIEPQGYLMLSWTDRAEYGDKQFGVALTTSPESGVYGVNRAVRPPEGPDLPLGLEQAPSPALGDWVDLEVVLDQDARTLEVTVGGLQAEPVKWPESFTGIPSFINVSFVSSEQAKAQFRRLEVSPGRD